MQSYISLSLAVFSVSLLTYFSYKSLKSKIKVITDIDISGNLMGFITIDISGLQKKHIENLFRLAAQRMPQFL